MDFKFKKNYSITDLLDIIKILRSPEGCPWDRNQNHKTIRENFLEEVYEVIEAIDTDDTNLLKEELGDVLLQIVFHSQFEQENGNFNFDDVVNGICEKLIVRHPHVFGEDTAKDEREALQSWNSAKMKTKQQNTQTEVLNGVSKALPSLVRSRKVQKKAADIGFDYDNVDEAMDKVREEYFELEQEINNRDIHRCEDELGDLLFSVVNVSRFIGVDAEISLTKSCDKFIKRFSKVEQIAKDKNIDLNSALLDQLNELWDQAKNLVNSR